MAGTIASTALFFIVVMMGLLLMMKGTPARPGWFAGPGPWSATCPNVTVRQGTIFFTVYVLLQVWNEINCRSLVPEVSGFFRLERNPVFLIVAAIIVEVQALDRELRRRPSFPPSWRLSCRDWLLMIAATASVLGYAELIRWLRKLMLKPELPKQARLDSKRIRATMTLVSATASLRLPT